MSQDLRLSINENGLNEILSTFQKELTYKIQ
jgi:hypothetical protein